MSAEEVIERLERRFKLGSKPPLRRALYQRLGQTVEDDPRALLVIAETAEYAARSKGDPGRCFAWVIVRRMVERGIWPAPEL